MPNKIMMLDCDYSDQQAIRATLERTSQSGSYEFLPHPVAAQRRGELEGVIKQNPDSVIVRCHSFAPYSGLDAARDLRAMGYQGAIFTTYYSYVNQLLEEAGRRPETEELEAARKAGVIDGYCNEHSIFYNSFSTQYQLAVSRRETIAARAEHPPGEAHPVVFLSDDARTQELLEAAIADHGREAYRLTAQNAVTAKALEGQSAVVLELQPTYTEGDDPMARALEKAKRVRELGYKGPVILLTGHRGDMSTNDQDRVDEAVRTGLITQAFQRSDLEILPDAVMRWMDEQVVHSKRQEQARAVEQQKRAYFEECKLAMRLEHLPDDERVWPEAMRLSEAEIRDVRAAVKAVAYAPEDDSGRSVPQYREKELEGGLTKAYLAALEGPLRKKTNPKSGQHRWDEKAGQPRPITDAERQQTKDEAKAWQDSSQKALGDMEYRYYDRMCQRLDHFTHRREHVTIPADPLASIRYSKDERKRYPTLGEERVETHYVEADLDFPHVQQNGHGRVLDLKSGMDEAQAQVRASGVVFGDQKAYDAAVNAEFAKRIIDMLAASKRLAGDVATERPKLEKQALEALEGVGTLPMRMKPTAVEAALRRKENEEMKERSHRGGGLDAGLKKVWVERAAGELGIAISGRAVT